MAQTRRQNLPFGQKVTPSDPGGVDCCDFVVYAVSPVSERKVLEDRVLKGKPVPIRSTLFQFTLDSSKGQEFVIFFSSCYLSFLTIYFFCYLLSDPPGGISKQKNSFTLYA